MAYLENSLKLKELFYQQIKTEERSLPTLEKLKLAEECQKTLRHAMNMTILQRSLKN